MQKPVAKSGEMCRYFNKDVSKVCHKCHHFVKLVGTNKNTGQFIDEWMCADVAQVILLAESAQMSRETGAAVESLRNRVHEGNQVLAAGVQMKMLEQSNHKKEW